MRINLVSSLLRRPQWAAVRRRRNYRVAMKSAAGTAVLAGGMLFAGEAAAQLPGWAMDPTTTPVGGPPEFYGWTFLDKNSWDATAGQDRGQFTKGQGTIAVADGDEYDDTGVLGGGSRAMNVFLTTPAIDLTAVPGGAAIQLSFDSSFRPYDVQTGLVEVSFDGGASFQNLLTLDTDNSGGNSALNRVDESVSLNLSPPSASTSALVRFGYTQADNDWWWAIDNVRVSAGATTLFSENFESIPLGPFVSATESGGDGTDWAAIPPVGLELVVNKTTGAASLALPAGAALPREINFYEILSDSGLLSTAGWNSFSDQNLDPVDGGQDPGETWDQGGAASARLLTEAFLLGSSSVAPGESLTLGAIYAGGENGAEDLSFSFGLANGSLIEGLVRYELGGSAAGADFDGSGRVTGADLLIWQRGFGGGGGLPAGDADANGIVNGADLAIWQDQFGDTIAAAANAATAPEPAAAILAGAGIAAVVARRRRTL